MRVKSVCIAKLVSTNSKEYTDKKKLLGDTREGGWYNRERVKGGRVEKTRGKNQGEDKVKAGRRGREKRGKDRN